MGLLVGTIPAQAGTVEPPSSAVDGAGDPVATGATPPAWDKALPANDSGDPCHSSRFTCVMGGQAVRDNETGLVWEQSPSTNGGDWLRAIRHCATREVVGRKGWHLPLREQIASLVDTSNASPALPTGHPFDPSAIGTSSVYYSATSDSDDPTLVWGVFFQNGDVTTIDRIANRPAWCVRGGQVFDGQDNLAVIKAVDELLNP